MMIKAQDAVLLETIEHLESRLRLVHHAVIGDHEGLPSSTDSDSINRPITERLSQLERALERLSEGSQVIQELLQLYARHPDWFRPARPNEVPSLLGDDEQLAIVMSMVTIFPETVSRLTSVEDLSVPPTETYTGVLKELPRMQKLSAVQERQAHEVAQLRHRSALALERWYRHSVMGSGECWAEWDARMRQAEQKGGKLKVVFALLGLLGVASSRFGNDCLLSEDVIPSRGMEFESQEHMEYGRERVPAWSRSDFEMVKKHLFSKSTATGNV
ncbi:MAG: 37S ribosomal protein S16, mitochondrial [Watsoniomyces obsoletus]|nr:MAG: 37S ribosomal protein S16, mitochondrial [Watsoniomyces obsoletus]